VNVSSDTGSPGQFRTKGSTMVVVVVVVVVTVSSYHCAKLGWNQCKVLILNEFGLKMPNHSQKCFLGI